MHRRSARTPRRAGFDPAAPSESRVPSPFPSRFPSLGPRRGRPRRPPAAAIVLLAAGAAANALAGQDAAPIAKGREPVVRVETVQGTLSGAAATLSFSAAASTLAIGDRQVPVGDAILMELDPEPRPSGSVTLFLRGGEEITIALDDGNESEVVGTSPSVQDAVARQLRIPLDRIRALAVPARFPSAASYLEFRRSLRGGSRRPIPTATATGAPAPADGGSGTDGTDGTDGTASAENDIAITLEGARLEGILGQVNASGVDFESEAAGKVHLPFTKLRGVELAQIGDGLDDRGAPATGVAAAISLGDGSYIEGELLELGDGRVEMRSRALGKVRAPLDDVRSVEFRGGRAVMLSDIDPVRVHHRADLFAPRPVERDANAAGGPLRIRGQHFRKGLGMLSHARLDYDLGGAFVRFQATIGMDDAARPESLEAEINDGGVALFRVHVDDRVAFQKELSFRDPPLAIDIPVEGATRLGLEVDYGRGFLILDYADWALPRLIRKEEKR